MKPVLLARCLAAPLFSLTAACVLAQTQGVSANEVLVGSISDLSGPVAGYGKDVRNGLQMRVAEINEKGGIHGRKLRLLVEDNAYDPKRSVLAAQKLVNQDKVFAVVGTFGTVHTLAAMQVQFPKNVFNLFPMALSRDMYEPLHKLKYAMISSYFDQVRAVVPKLYRSSNARKACVLFQDDDYGHEVVKGAEAGLQLAGTEVAERTSFKRGATDFSSQVARLKAANCDFVVMGTLIRETVGAIAEARKLDYAPTFLAASSAYTDLIPRLGGKAMDGFYAATTAQHPYLDDASEPIRVWANRYQARFKEAPTVFSVYGYTMIDLMGRALEKAGTALDTDSFARAMEGLSDVPGDIFGNPPMRFSPTQHLGSDKVRLSQLQNGRWKVVLDYDQMN
ncbi:ABC transporter substrate-binding protein [Pseudorhodoferax sp. Leaf274]|uniref:ABC transporter substrate-binding protein n=1 Tax=Pseudorhodoferax sp. Leaf274 TaxID=1736318 RepID=UPI000A6B41A6|nr:ABC transporter substrate-binding protein [Pseudorhodoferax sp. Leaf274]